MTPLWSGSITGTFWKKAALRLSRLSTESRPWRRFWPEKFDLAIVDVNMPKMDGFSLVRSLRGSAPAVATLPVLVITTEAGQQDREDARSAGANFYLVKPVSEDDLVRHVSVLTGEPI